MSSQVHFCLLCRLPLPVASKRRGIHPVSEVNADIHEFFVRTVAPGYAFSPCDTPKYLCRYPCYSTLEKALKSYISLQEHLSTMRSQLDVCAESPVGLALSPHPPTPPTVTELQANQAVKARPKGAVSIVILTRQF